MEQQLNKWKTEWGDAYTTRNAVDWRLRLSAWKEMIGDLELNHAIEIGCNRGHNLRAIAELGNVGGNIIGVEPNLSALQIARGNSPLYTAVQGDSFNIPFVDGYADLVFTAGVLIHIAPHDLPNAISEMYRVSKSHILCIEYFSESETSIPYHGHNDLLWKRDFRKQFLKQYPDLRVVKEGYWDLKDGFDRTHWWMFAKGI